MFVRCEAGRDAYFAEAIAHFFLGLAEVEVEGGGAVDAAGPFVAGDDAGAGACWEGQCGSCKRAQGLTTIAVLLVLWETEFLGQDESQG